MATPRLQLSAKFTEVARYRKASYSAHSEAHVGETAGHVLRSAHSSAVNWRHPPLPSRQVFAVSEVHTVMSTDVDTKSVKRAHLSEQREDGHEVIVENSSAVYSLQVESSISQVFGRP